MVDLPDKMYFRPCSRAQSDFLKARPPGGLDGRHVFETMYSGAYGAGKTRALCMKATVRATVPGAREGLARKTLVALKDTTLRTLLEQDGPHPPILPPGTYTHNKSDKEIKIIGGGSIHYFGCDDPIKTRSKNLSGCGLDEVTEFSEEDYITIIGRIRVKIDNHLELYCATNPDAKSHYLYNRFSIGNAAERLPYRWVVQTSSRENQELPEAYLNTLDDFTGQFRERYFEGLWGNFEGMIYADWDREKHLLDTELQGEMYAGVDDGSGKGHEFCIIVGVLTSTNDMQTIDEVYHEGMLQDEKVNICRELADRYGIDTFWVDPAAAGLILDLRNVDLNAIAARNVGGGVGGRKVNVGIGKIQRRLAVNSKLGRPRLLVHPRCVNLIREIEGYHWEPGRDVPHKENDHAVDALRYMIMSLDRAGLVDHEPGPGPGPLKETPRFMEKSWSRDEEELVLARDNADIWDDADD